MARAEAVKIESDEAGFELHVLLDEDVCTHSQSGDWLVVNVQAVAEELFDAVKSSIGPWLQEKEAAFAEFRAAGGHPMCPDEDGRCLHGRDEECPKIDGEQIAVENLLHLADHVRKVYREGGAA